MTSQKQAVEPAVATLSLEDFFGKEIRPHFLACAQGLPGKAVLITVFALCFSLFNSPAFAPIILAIIVCSFTPRLRWQIVAWATLAVFILEPFWFNPALPEHIAAQEGVTARINFVLLRYGMGLLYFCFALGLLACKSRFQPVLPLRRPILSLLVLYFALVFLASEHACHGVAQVLLWSFIGIFGGYFWFLGYALLAHNPASPHLGLQMGTFHPFWGSSTTPIGKGLAYLRKVAAKDDAEFAIAQIKGLRLIIDCLVLRLVLIVFQQIIHVHFAIPSFDDAFARQTAGSPYRPVYCWAGLVASFFESVLNMAIWGNSIVACARLAGFNLLRNTYRPLQSRTIAQFWNRFYFYFKELLVDFFFYPAFFRCFKRHKRLRIVFATFMAASVGNVIFHFMRDVERVSQVGLWQAVSEFQSYAFYSVLLSTGIAISQLRPRAPAQDGFFRGTLLPAFLVAAFFCLIHIFGDLTRHDGLAVRFAFLFHLFGLG